MELIGKHGEEEIIVLLKYLVYAPGTFTVFPFIS